MLTGSTSSCIEKLKRKKLLTTRNFDPVAEEMSAKAPCGPIDYDNKVIADLNSLLEQYADTLAALADEKLPSYKTELSNNWATIGQQLQQLAIATIGDTHSSSPPKNKAAQQNAQQRSKNPHEFFLW